MKKLILILLSLISISSAQSYLHGKMTGSKFNPRVRIANKNTTLTKNLIAFWKFDGNWEDSVGSNDLTPSGSPYVSETGVSGQAASFEIDSTQSASIADNVALSFGAENNVTVAAWIKTESSVSSTRGVAMKGEAGNSASFEYGILVRATNVARFYIDNGSSSYASYSSISQGTWTLVTGWYNTTTDSVYIQINNGTPVLAEAVNEPSDRTYAFMVGLAFDGLIDDVGVWNRSGNKITGKAFADSLYNAGAGWRP